jgi:S-disulfanyl-L-cysteine oxidoreductase SoxD
VKGGADGGDQVAQGGKLYAAECASCHGANGEGDPAPALVGATALPLDPPAGAKRSVQFRTGADVFGFVKANMPPKEAGKLSDAEYAAILAFALKANGVDMTGKHVDTSTAASFVLHP